MKKVLLTFFLPAIITCSAQKPLYKTAVIGFYNLENFYDTIKNPAINDDEFLPGGIRHYNSAVYLNKVAHLATVIAQMGVDINPDGPALLGVAEVENDTVLNDLTRHSLLLDRNYKFIHYDSRDARGMDVALLYNPKYFSVDTSNKLFVKIPAGSKSSYYTRDVLWVKGKLNGEEIYVLVNHWPSRVGGEQRSMPGRTAAAMVNKKFIDSVEKENSQAKIIVMGDFNDDPISPSITKVLNAKANMDDVKRFELYNPWIELYKRGIGTLAYQDAWGLFDQIMLNSSWLNKNQDGFFYYRQHIFNKSFLIENNGRYKGYPMRTWDGNTYRGGYSDHFPTYIIVLKKLH